MKDNAPKTGEELYQKLIDKLKSMPRNTDISLVEKAYKVAKEAHGAQARESGEPYIIHPLSVALILTDFELDNSAVAAAILHDVVEDTSYDIDYIKKEFGNEIAVLVDGVTKLGKIQFNSKEEQQAENFRKMLLAMAQDIRVILIKLADRLHNMRTLKYLPEDRQKRNAQETLDIYAPIAHRLGMYKIKWELEDLSLRYIDPKGYYELVSEINQKRDERETYIAIIIATLQERLKMLGIEADIEGRPKHFYSIYNKMKKQNKTIEQIYDLFAVRVIVNTVAECYTVLGMVHEMYKPIPNRFKDYISLPKQNMYRSLHTTVIGPQGQPFEVQIRTWEMHHVAETGIAAHWRYKEDNNNLGNDKDMDTKLAWLRQLLDVQKDTNDAKEFMDNLKINLFTDEVFVFTPKGDVVTLPADSTPIDFAYNIHSQIGNKMMGARVNGKIVTLNYILRNGDIVEILTSSNVQGPSRDWLKIAKSSTARNKITQWFKKEGKEQNILIGKDIVEREAKKLGMNPSKLFKESDLLYDILGKIGYQSLNDVFSSVGYGSLAPIKFLGRFKEELDKENEKSKTEAETLESMQNKLQKENEKQAQNKRRASSNGIIVKGVENCLVRLAKCCNPIPGEPIVGYITRGRGISVHRKNCSNIKELMDIEPRAIEVEWAGTDEAVYNVNLEVKASDNSGLLIGISNAVNEPKSRLKAINARTVDDIAIMTISLEIKSAEQLTRIIKNINAVKGVFEVVRVNN